MSQFTQYEEHHFIDYIYKAEDVDQKVNAVNTKNLLCLFYKDVDPEKVLFDGIINKWLVPENCVVKYIMLHIMSTENN